MRVPIIAWHVLFHVGISTQSAIQNAGNQTSYVHGAYYSSWSAEDGQPPSAMNVSILSHVYYAFAMLAEDGHLYHSDNATDLTFLVDGQKGGLKAFSHLKQRNPNLKLILSIGGESGSTYFASVASNAAKRTRFAQSARSWMDQFGFDGIDIDWEHPETAVEGANFLQLIQAARQQLPSPRYSISAAVAADQWYLSFLPLSKVSQILDQVNMMCYDFVGSWSATSGYQSPLYLPKNPPKSYTESSCDAAVSYTLKKGLQATKVVLGVPVYGWSFLNTTGPGQSFKKVGGSDGSFDYRDLPRPGAREYVNKEVVAAYSIGGDGGFVTYDNVDTVTIKAGYVKSRGLGGLFYWTGTGDAKGQRSLVIAGYNGLHSK
ncbi:glycoside hydrolase family 18 protein [Myriangium duriaei CBS 260.36]|uniref:chitinase n=1 Tax=Myriangium duriaei CBS 260.36 TaxID=1168546 RepID=A0A9P4MGJ8_9PEZI|nr:glycoside hydrolase family 18 protein [Myriangium duriaei CBS 260.36]